MQDSGYAFANARRRSNSSAQGLADFKTKFETGEPEPFFEERLHGPLAVDADGEMATEAADDSTNTASAEDPGKVAGKP
jgi:hypothetical protein